MKKESEDYHSIKNFDGTGTLWFLFFCLNSPLFSLHFQGKNKGKYPLN